MIYKIRKKVYIGIAVLFVFGLLWCSIRFMLPNKLTLVEGQTAYYDVKLPVSAKSEDSMRVLGVTTKPTADNLHLDLGTAVTAEGIEQGNTQVTFYLFDKLPVKTVDANVLPDIELIASGRTVGVQLDTDGLLVLGTGFVEGENGEKTEPCKGVLKTGDLIQKVNGQEMKNKESFLQAVEHNNEQPIVVEYIRNGKQNTTKIQPVYSPADNAYKLGVWVRDSIQGIGTVTFFDEETNRFGALGHGIYDVDTGGLMSLKQGHITSARLTEIVKGEKGAPGELGGFIAADDVLGDIEKNTEIGIFGSAETEPFTGDSYPIGLRGEVEEEKAVILSNIAGDTVIPYEIEVEQVNHFAKDCNKGMVIRVTDERLLQQTGGIVQGMSGSPILQNNKIIGAVTHVFVQDPTRGYGIFIEDMLQEERNIA